MKFFLKKYWLWILGFLLTLSLLFVVVAAWWELAVPRSADTTLQLVKVESGQSIEQIADELLQKEVTKCKWWFVLAAQIKRQPLKAGNYYFSQSQSALEILSEMINGKVSEIQATLIEGWRGEEILGELISKTVIMSRDEFSLAIVAEKHPEIKKRFDLNDGTLLEGFLFPDTYRFKANGTAANVVDKMIDNFVNRTEDLSLDYSKLILASIVEREARNADDRAAIAGVYQNRLDLGMKLDADPTVQYAKGMRDNPLCVLGVKLNKGQAVPVNCADLTWWPKLVSGEAKTLQASYNTYLNAGLPPTPISNPGIASIEAAVNAEKHDYYYFVTDVEGRAHFAKTFADHQENIRKYINN